MAKRLATIYVKACLRLTEAEMAEFMKMFQEQHLSVRMKVFENGNQELVLVEDMGEEVTLAFERQANVYVLQGSYRFNTAKMANIMRKAVSLFKGEAIVNRVYPSFTMIYHYEKGSVVKIVEQNGERRKVIYEYRHSLGRLKELLHSCSVENEIGRIHDEINALLDLRNTGVPDKTAGIDNRLEKLAHRLFVLEA